MKQIDVMVTAGSPLISIWRRPRLWLPIIDIDVRRPLSRQRPPPVAQPRSDTTHHRAALGREIFWSPDCRCSITSFGGWGLHEVVVHVIGPVVIGEMTATGLVEYCRNSRSYCRCRVPLEETELSTLLHGGSLLLPLRVSHYAPIIDLMLLRMPQRYHTQPVAVSEPNSCSGTRAMQSRTRLAMVDDGLYCCMVKSWVNSGCPGLIGRSSCLSAEMFGGAAWLSMLVRGLPMPRPRQKAVDREQD
jgi:hypothetical protein